jgi:aryl-alcohol dehydrogenase-like predicted oxidoreductase
MRYTLLGNSGLRVSELALGTMTFGTDWGFGAAEDESLRQVEVFAEAGGNFIDTANNYTNGTSEKLVGTAIAADRDYWVVATKYTLTTRPDDPNAAGNHRKNLVRTLETSLRRLGTDHVDLLWLHAWDDLTPVEEVVRALDDQVRAGKVHYVGVSDSPAWVGAYGQALAHLRGYTPFAGMQVPYSLAERDVERELLPMARAMGMGVCAWGPLAGGLLSGKYAPGAPDDGAPRRLAHQSAHRLAIAAEVAEVAGQVGATSAQVALAWVRAQGAIPLLGGRRAGQIVDNLRCLEIDLDDEQLARLDRASGFDPGFPRTFLDSMTGIIHGDGIRERLDVPASYRR